MMELEITRENEVAVPLDENILNFLDYTNLLIAQTKTADDVDLLMIDFMADDMTNVLEQHKYLFRVTSVVWLEAFKRIFIDGNEKNFPVSVLYLPILFKKLGWEFSDKAYLYRLFKQCFIKAEQSEALYDYLVLLFMDGLCNSPKSALARLIQTAEKFEFNDIEKARFNTMIEEIRSLGWV